VGEPLSSEPMACHVGLVSLARIVAESDVHRGVSPGPPTATSRATRWRTPPGSITKRSPDHAWSGPIGARGRTLFGL